MALAWSHLQRVNEATSPDLRAIAADVWKAPQGDRALELQRRAPPGGFEAHLAAELLAAPTGDDRVAAVNEALADVEHSLSEGARWPGAAVRIAAWGTTCIAALDYLAGGGGESIAIVAALGAASVIVCVSVERRATQITRERREAVDDLMTALFGRPPPATRARGEAGQGDPSGGSARVARRSRGERGRKGRAS